jgi:hypothetical protein
MRDYSRVRPVFWQRGTGREIVRSGNDDAIILSQYLMGAPGSNMIGRSGPANCSSSVRICVIGRVSAAGALLCGIRSLARDIALALGTVGHVTMLRRLRAGPFDLAQAISLDKLETIAKGATLEHMILPLEAGLDDIPALDLDPEQARAVRQGRVLAGLPQSDGLWLARSGMIPVALVDLADGALRVSRGFNLSDVAE